MKNVQLVPVEPEVKCAETCKLFNAGVSANAGSPKTADPSCYNAPVAQTSNPAVGAAGLFDKVEMKT